MKSWKSLLLALILAATLPTMAQSAGMADYLILQDIGMLKVSTPQKALRSFAPIGGPRIINGATVVDGAGHFDEDHTDTTYEIEYFDTTKTYPSPTVQVTQHAGGDSDRWLLHEIEDPFRDGEPATLGQLTDGTRIREINNNKVLYFWVGTVVYCWTSGNVTVKVEYSNLTSAKPEPLEIVKAYLQKFPSTLPTTLVLNTNHDIVWIKDEMERRIWLCDKWFGLVVADDPKLSEKLKNVVKSMKIFLDYRDKYFGIVAKDEKVLLERYLAQKDEVSLRAKLTEYKKWWGENKDVAISLP